MTAPKAQAPKAQAPTAAEPEAAEGTTAPAAPQPANTSAAKPAAASKTADETPIFPAGAAKLTPGTSAQRGSLAPSSSAEPAVASSSTSSAIGQTNQANEPVASNDAITPRVSTKADDFDAALTRPEQVGKPPESARWLLIGVGLGSTAVWYAGALGIRELWPSQADRSDLRIPVVGPFIDLSHTGCPSSNPGCSTFQLVARTILVSLDAIGQAGGIAMLLQGAVLSTAPAAPPTPGAVRRHRSITATGLNVVPTPWIDAQRGAGIGLSGRF